MAYGPQDKQHRLYEYLRRTDDGRPAILVEEGMARWLVTQGLQPAPADGDPLWPARRILLSPEPA
jgi:hypothetical protein